MTRFHQCKDNELDEETLELLKPFRVNGELAPVYRQMANSAPAIKAYLQMEKAIANCSLSLSEIEAIKLYVSQLNQCDFCLSVHSRKAKAAGLAKETQLAIRKGQATGDKRLDAILGVVSRFFNSPGTLSEASVSELREQGLEEPEMLDLVLVTSTIFLTNTFNHLNDTQLVFPKADELN